MFLTIDIEWFANLAGDIFLLFGFAGKCCKNFFSIISLHSNGF